MLQAEGTAYAKALRAGALGAREEQPGDPHGSRSTRGVGAGGQRVLGVAGHQGPGQVKIQPRRALSSGRLPFFFFFKEDFIEI